jgi:hypothetical protein
VDAAIDRAAVHAAIEHHHLTINAVEGTQSEAAIVQQLADRYFAVITAGDETRDGGDLVSLPGRAGNAVAVNGPLP